ncbi:PH domain-containing protein [Streptomyces sp. NPDC006996]|uniref:PH domain-containing protein n=1 Tax=Streptomyces sp. NPDC006996 TaxID=3156908 RepID=UPI0034055072
MSDAREVTCRPRWTGALWILVGLGAAGTAAAVALWAYTGVHAWPAVGVLPALTGLVALWKCTARLRADARGLHSRTLLRRRSVPWSEVADLRLRLMYAQLHRSEESRRVSVLLRDGRTWVLPLPRSWTSDAQEFDETLEALRALHRRHGPPEATGEPAHRTVISAGTTGSGWTGSLLLCALLPAGAGLSVWAIPSAGAYERDWTAAVPCAAEPGRQDPGDCLTVAPAVIRYTEPQPNRKTSWLYITGARPLERLAVSQEAADAFRPGDRVRLTWWRGEVKAVAGDRHTWRDHTAGVGDLAMVAAGLTLVAGYPAARMLLRVRSRRRPDGEVLPSALPFAAALAVTALWLLPLCYLHPTAPFASPTTTTWTALGTVTTLTLVVRAWRTTRIRPPGPLGPPGETGEPLARPGEPAEGEVFLPPVSWRPPLTTRTTSVPTSSWGGDGPPAVIPHSGPGRFAARPVPVSRLTLQRVRRARGDDPGVIPGDWHVAELDDAGTPVRLAAAPADLTRILRELPARRTRPDQPSDLTAP